MMMILLSSTSIAQTENHFQFIKKIPGKYTYFNVDALENIYVITPDFQLKKMNSEGAILSTFNDVKKYGTPSFIDVSNPLKNLIFYKSYGIIVTLDKLLTFRNSINLRSNQLFNVAAIATSYDNNIWLFDGASSKIKKLDDLGNTISEGQELTLFGDNIPERVDLLANEKQLLLYDEHKGFYCFDWNGTFKDKVIPFLNWKNVGLSENAIYGFSANKLLSYEWQSLNLKEFNLPEGLSDNNKMKVVNRKLYVLTDDGVRIYEIE
jgi:hypothetical protein